jgi:transcriptional regulator with XRE-family HTH domain
VRILNEKIINSNITDNLKYLRESNNITQKDFATLMNVSQASYQKYEYGERIPDVISIYKICKRFNIPLDTFISSKINALNNVTLFLNTLIMSTRNNEIMWNMYNENSQDKGGEIYTNFSTECYINDLEDDYGFMNTSVTVYQSYINNKNVYIVHYFTNNGNIPEEIYYQQNFYFLCIELTNNDLSSCVVICSQESNNYNVLVDLNTEIAKQRIEPTLTELSSYIEDTIKEFVK